MAIINGRRINVNNIPKGGVYGRQLIEEAGFDKLRRPVMQRGGFNFETVDPNRRYGEKDLVDKKGKGIKFTSIPVRDKGGFGGRRDALSKCIITEQVHDVAENLFKQGVDFDEENAGWVVVSRFNLPPKLASHRAFERAYGGFPGRLSGATTDRFLSDGGHPHFTGRPFLRRGLPQCVG